MSADAGGKKKAQIDIQAVAKIQYPIKSRYSIRKRWSNRFLGLKIKFSQGMRRMIVEIFPQKWMNFCNLEGIRGSGPDLLFRR